MREIKYRAWDKNEHKYHYFSGIFNNAPCKDTSTFPQYEHYYVYNKLEEEEQYTGLKDKNGKEIYEGDKVYDNANKTECEIVFCDGAFCMKDDENEELYVMAEFACNMFLEVIGNIHETPELLEQQ